MTRACQLQDVLGFGDLPEQVAEQMRRFPHSLDQIEALIVDEATLALHGRWAGEAEPHRWQPSWSGDSKTLRLSDAETTFDAVPRRRDRRQSSRPWFMRRLASGIPLRGGRP